MVMDLIHPNECCYELDKPQNGHLGICLATWTICADLSLLPEALQVQDVDRKSPTSQ